MIKYFSWRVHLSFALPGTVGGHAEDEPEAEAEAESKKFGSLDILDFFCGAKNWRQKK